MSVLFFNRKMMPDRSVAFQHASLLCKNGPFLCRHQLTLHAVIELQSIQKKTLSGVVPLPLSKSIANRLLMLRVLSGGQTGTDFIHAGTDVELMHQALNAGDDPFDFRDAGTPLRFFIAYAAVVGKKGIITGNERLKLRPLFPLLSALEQLGARFEFLEKNGCLPLRVIRKTDLSSKEVSVDAGISSQFISALMLLAPVFENGLLIRTKGSIVSEPYIQMTSACLKSAGIQVTVRSGEIYTEHGQYGYPGLQAEADWSAACFPYGWAAASLQAELFLPGLKLASVQGDAIAATVFKNFGIESFETGQGVRIVKKGEVCRRFEFDCSDCPDMFPVLAAVCSLLRIPSVFTGVRNLRLKESDRIAAMRENLLQTGAELTEDGQDSILLELVPLRKGKWKFYSFADHRIAMACSLFAFINDVIIDDENAVHKSFPDYWDVMKRTVYSES